MSDKEKHDHMLEVAKFTKLERALTGGDIKTEDSGDFGILSSAWNAITNGAKSLFGIHDTEFGYVDENGEFVFKTCFVAGTKIRIRNGYKNIEDIRVGDEVLSWNEITGKLSFQKVEHTFIRKTPAIYKIIYSDGGVVETTWNHPFYIAGKGWVEARHLKATDSSFTATAIAEQNNQANLEIAAIDVDKRSETVYNFSVKEFHNYFVTESDILVHNLDPEDYTKFFENYKGTAAQIGGLHLPAAGGELEGLNAGRI